MHARLGIFCALVFCCGRVAAAPAIAAALSGRVLYDSNLFLQDAGPLAAGQHVRATPAREASAGATAALSLRAEWKAGPGSVLSLSYAPEAFRYFGHASENHVDHLLTLGGEAAQGPWAEELKLSGLFVDGSREALVFNGLGGGPAIGGEPVRSRRAQIVARAAGKATRKEGPWFVRGDFGLVNQDFETVHRSTAGYVNYADRSEAWAGAAAGYFVAPQAAFVGAVRPGWQRQANVLGEPLNYSNTFTRWLGGVELSLGKTLKAAFLAGPDDRHFGNSIRAGLDHHPHTTYSEGSLAWSPSAADSVALTEKQYLWPGSGGRCAYVDRLITLAWTRRITSADRLALSASTHDGDLGPFTAAARNDRINLGGVSWDHAFGKKVRAALELARESAVSLVPNTPARGYGRNLASLTIARGW